jgi:phosphoglycolate phosphatase
VEFTSSILLEDVTLMPGTLELLRSQHAAGVKLAVFTNKRGDQARQICAHLGITPFMNGVFGAKDTAWLKPQREFAEHVLVQLNAKRETTMLIGDSPFDVQAAHNGGFACWCVTTGTHDETQLRAAHAEAVYPDLFALRAALEK